MGQFRRFAIACAVIALLFAKPLFDLIHFALQSSTFSHVILIPLISAYLASLRRRAIIISPPCASVAVFLALAAGATLSLLNWILTLSTETRLCLFTLAFVCFTIGAGSYFLGAPAMRELAFPFGLLFLMAPLPPVVMNALEAFFQHASASTAAMLMKLSSLPAYHDGLFFLLPGLRIEVAQECSGIRSTLVLFITSLIVGHLFLRRTRDQVVLAAAIVPLAILRNGFRIFSLAWLSVEVDPNIIHSALHHRGGPIFFALSLVPLFFLVLILRRLERKPIHAS